ncbi:hypothetical protein CCACVL1_08568, partial [Corchorus capsularis]
TVQDFNPLQTVENRFEPSKPTDPDGS